MDEFGNYSDLKIKIKKIWQELADSKKAFEDKNELEFIKKEREQIEFNLKEIESLEPLENEFNELIKKDPF